MAFEITYPSKGEILQLHRKVVERYGGSLGVIDEKALESALGQPQMQVFGVERHATLFEKAAAYAYYIARNHPSFDGNKRTAFLAALHFLIINGAIPSFDNDQISETMLALAEGKIALNDLAEIFQKACEL